MVNTGRGGPRRARKTFSVTETYWLAGEAGTSVELQTTLSVYGCQRRTNVASRFVLRLLDDLSKTLVKYGFSEGQGNVDLATHIRPPRKLEVRAKRSDGYRSINASNYVLPRTGKEPGDKE